jgi:hypothetical protein
MQGIFSNDNDSAKRLGCESDANLDKALRGYLKPGFTLLIGEMHGTKESPQFVQDVACSALRAEHKVTLALEIPKNEGNRLQGFIRGKSTDLTRSDFWMSAYQDGRSSIAMRGLIEKIRSWRESKYPIRLLAIDNPNSHGGEREKAMAESLVEDIENNKDDIHIVLTGNIHNRLEQGVPWDPTYAPMGSILAKLTENNVNASIVSLAPQYDAGGNAYVCTGEDGSSCGATILASQTPSFNCPSTDREGRCVSIKEIGPRRFLGQYYFTRPVNASGPAFAAVVSVASTQ